jgi:hypothetical protein
VRRVHIRGVQERIQSLGERVRPEGDGSRALRLGLLRVENIRISRCARDETDADAEAPTIPDASSLARSPLHLAISLINR